MPPVQPDFNIIIRSDGKVSAEELRDEKRGATLKALFGGVLTTTAKDHEGKETPLHKMIDGRKETKQAWIKYANEQFEHDENGCPGPLIMYQKNVGKEWQNKLKYVVLDNAEYFNKLYTDKFNNYGACAGFDFREERGHQIWMERQKSIAENEQRKEEEKNGGGNKRKRKRSTRTGIEKAPLKEKENAEKEIGLVSPGRGISAPSLKEGRSKNDDDGLLKLGQQPESPTCMCISIASLIS